MQNPFGNGNNDDNNNNNNDNNDPRNLIPIPPNFATVVNKKTGQIRIAKVGLSFTALFFQFLVPVFRSDWYNFFCMLGVEVIAGMGLSMYYQQPFNVTWTLAEYALGFLWLFIYNMMYFKHLFKLGYVPADQRSKELLVNAHYLKDDGNDSQD